MTRWLVQSINSVLLIVLLIGIPAATSMQVGTLRLSSVPTFQLVTLWGLGVAASANAMGALLGPRPLRRAMLSWCVIFLLLGVVELLLFRDVINFEWLKQFLLWIKTKLR